MLLQFTVKNYKVFKDSITFSMLASNYDKATYENDNVHVAAQFNDEIAIEVVNGINQLKLIHSSAQSIYEKYTKDESGQTGATHEYKTNSSHSL